MNVADLTPEQLQGAAALAAEVMCKTSKPRKQAVIKILQKERPAKLVEIASASWPDWYGALEQFLRETNWPNFGKGLLKPGDVVKTDNSIKVLMSKRTYKSEITFDCVGLLDEKYAGHSFLDETEYFELIEGPEKLRALRACAEILKANNFSDKTIIDFIDQTIQSCNE